MQVLQTVQVQLVEALVLQAEQAELVLQFSVLQSAMVLVPQDEELQA